jgi:hypothetical protein
VKLPGNIPAVWKKNVDGGRNEWMHVGSPAVCGCFYTNTTMRCSCDVPNLLPLSILCQ